MTTASARKARPSKTPARRRAVNFDLRTAEANLAQWDRMQREREAENAQTSLLHALAFADEIRDDVRRETKHWPTAKREREIEAQDTVAAKVVRAAIKMANAPTVLSKRITGKDIERVARGLGIPRKSRHLAGIRAETTNDLRAIGTPSWYGSDERTVAMTLRSHGGRVLATVIAAGAARELQAYLLAALDAWEMAG